MEGKTFTTTIESISYEGLGICNHQGKIFFIQNSWPGDEVLIEITKEKKNYGYGKVLKYLNKNPSENDAKLCEFQDLCGGCAFIKYNYKSQLKEKSKLLESLKKRFKIDFNKEIVITPSPELGFKNRIQLHKKNDMLGFKKKKSHQIVSIDKCVVANDKINEFISYAKKEAPSLPNKVYLDDRMTKEELLKQVNKGFRQGNDFINDKMKDYVKSKFESTSYHKGIELFCGQGNFTKLLLPFFDKLLCIDSFTGELQNQSSKLHVIETDIYKVESIKEQFRDAQVLFLDPPRSGHNDLDRIITQLPNLELIIYISCNPSTCFQDISKLPSDFEVSSIQGFDAYPHTPHLEVIVTLTRAITHRVSTDF